MTKGKAIPSIEELSKANFEDFCSLTSQVQVNDTELEAFLETNMDAMDKFVDDISDYSASKLRDDLTAAVIESIPFPYKTTPLKSKRKEIIEWLARHKSMRTNNIDLLRQRIMNHFKMQVHNMASYKQEKISSFVRHKFEYIKQNLK